MAAFGVIFWLCIIGIAYIYAGYPLVLLVLALLHPRPRAYPSTTPTVTLLIAAYNEADVIAAKLKNAASLDYPADRLQILVAADGSEDRTVEIVRDFPEAAVDLSYEPQRRGKMAAINRAMQMVRHEVVVFSDANNLYATNALREIVAPFADPAVGAVSGSKQILASGEMLGAAEGLYWRYESFIREKESLVGSCTGVSGEILAIRRELFEAPRDDIINDDFSIALGILRKGYRLAYAPRARSFEYGSATMEDESKRRERIIAGRYQALAVSFGELPWSQPVVMWQLFSHKFMRPLVPLLMILALAVNVAAVVRPVPASGSAWLVLAGPFNWILLALQVLFYALAYLGSRFRLSGALGKVLYLPVFLVKSNLSALRGLFGFLGGRQSATWERVRRKTVSARTRG